MRMFNCVVWSPFMTLLVSLEFQYLPVKLRFLHDDIVIKLYKAFSCISTLIFIKFHKKKLEFQYLPVKLRFLHEHIVMKLYKAFSCISSQIFIKFYQKILKTGRVFKKNVNRLGFFSKHPLAMEKQFCMIIEKGKISTSQGWVDIDKVTIQYKLLQKMLFQL